MDEPLSVELNSDKPVDKEYKKKRVDEIGSELAQIRARFKASRACSKKEDENPTTDQKLPREKLSEKSELYMQVLEQDKVKAQKLEKERPKIKEAIENLMIDRENQKLVEKQIEETRVKLLSAPLAEIPQEVQKRILDMETTILILKENLAEKESVLQSKADSWRVVTEELDRRNAETVERAERMRREIDSVREAYAVREKLLLEELEAARRQLIESQEELMHREYECRDGRQLQSELSEAHNYIGKLREEVKCLQIELERAQNELGLVRGELSDTRGRLMLSESNCSKITEELDSLHSSHSGCEAKFIEMKKAWDVEKRLALKLKAQLKNLHNEISSKQMENLSGEVERLQNQVVTLEEEKGNLQLQLVDFDDVKENALKNTCLLKDLELSLKATSDELNTAKESYNKLKEDSDIWAVHLKLQEDKIAALEEHATRAEQLKLEAELRSAAVEEKLDAALLGVTSPESTVPVSILMKRMAGDLVHEWTDRLTEVEEMTSQLTADRVAMAADYEGQLHEWSVRYSQLEAEYTQLINENVKLMNQQDSVASDWKARYCEMEAKFTQSTTNRDAVILERDNLMTELLGLKMERDSLVHEKNNLIHERDTLISEKENSTGDEQLRLKAKKIAAALKAKAVQLKQVEGRLAEAEIVLAQTREENLQLELALNESRATEATVGDRSPQDLADANKMLEQQVEDLESRLADAVSNGEVLSTRLAAAENSLLQMEKDLSVSQKDVLALHQTEEEQKNIIASLKRQLEEMELNFIEQQQNSQRVHQAEEAAAENALRSRLMEVEGLLSERTEELSQLKETESRRVEEASKLREVETFLKSQLEILESELSSLRQEGHLLRQSETEMQLLRVAEQKHLDQVQSKVKELETALASEWDHHSKLQEECEERVQIAEKRSVQAVNHATELEAELNDIKSAYATTLDQIEVLNEELKVVMGEIEGRNEQLIRFNSEKNKLVLDLKNYEHEIANLKEELATVRNQQEGECEWAAEAKREAGHQDNNAIRKENEKLREETHTFKIKCAKLAQRVKDLKAQIEKREKESSVGITGLDELGLAEELRGQVDSLEADKAKLSSDLAAVKDERDKLKTKINILTSANEQLLDLKERCDIEVQGYRRTIADLRSHSSFDWGEPNTGAVETVPSGANLAESIFQEKASVLEAENAELQQAVNDVRSEKQNLFYEINALKDQVQRLQQLTPVPLASNIFSDVKEAFLGHDTVAGETETTHDNKDNENLFKQSGDFFIIREELEAQLSQLKIENEAIKNENHRLIGEIKKLSSINEDLVGEARESGHTSQTIQEETSKQLEYLKKELLDAQEKSQEINIRNYELEKSKDEALKNVDLLEKDIAQTNEEIDHLKRTVVSLMEENVRLKAESVSACDEVTKLKIMLDNMKIPEQKQENQPVAESDQNVTSPPIFKGFFSDSDDPFAGVGFPVKEEVSVKKSSISLQGSQGKGEIEEVLQDRLNQAEKEKMELLKQVEEIQSAAQEMDTLRNQKILELEGEIQAHQNQVTIMKQRLEGKTHEHEVALSRINELEKEVKVLQDNITTLHQGLSDASRDNDGYLKRVHDLECEVQTLRGQIVSLNAELKESNQSHEAKVNCIQDLEREVLELRGHISLQNEAMKDSGKERDDNIGRVLELEKEVLSLQEQIKSLQIFNANHSEELATEGQNLRQQLQDVMLERDHALGQIHHLEKEIQVFKEKLQDLNKMNSSSEKVQNLELEVQALRSRLSEIQTNSAEETQNREAWFQHALLAKEEEAGQLRQEVAAAIAAQQNALREQALAAGQAAEAEIQRDSALAAKEEAERRITEAVSSSDAELKYLSDGIAERDAIIAERDSELAQKNELLALKDQILMQKDDILSQRDSIMAELSTNKEQLERELSAACERCTEVEKNISQREEEWCLLRGSAEEVEKLRSALEAKENEVAQLGKLFVEAQERLVAAEQNRPGGKELAGLRARLDDALYTVHLRDIKCEELTREIMQLLEERDMLQLRLSEALKANLEMVGKSSPDNQSPSPAALDPSFYSKLNEVHSGYLKDPVVKQEQQNRHTQQMSLLNPADKAEKAEEIGLFQWIFGGSSSNEQT